MSGNYPHNGETNPSKIIKSIQALYEGRSNATGSFTCTQNAASTVVTAPNCSVGSKVVVSARHANAAAELGNGTGYVSAVAQGAFTFTHANSATANRNFDYVIQG